MEIIMNNFIKIILILSTSLNLLNAEKIELIPADIFNKSVEEYLEIVEEREVDLKQIEDLKKIEETEIRQSIPNHNIKYQLKLNITPKDASFKFLKPENIVYSYGKSLPKGEYIIKVYKQGYKTEEVKIELNKPISKRIKLKRKVRYCKLNVIPNVSNASIRILNIRQRYKRNISLPCNRRYDIEVTKRGFKNKLFYTSLKTDEVIRPKLQKKYTPPRYCALTIIPTTNRARVRITNILPTYKRGIRLPCNRTYNIKVSQRGYKTRRVHIKLTERNEKIPIRLYRY